MQLLTVLYDQISEGAMASDILVFDPRTGNSHESCPTREEPYLLFDRSFCLPFP